ncbi:zinc transporter ZntB [Pontiella sp.]|uniref:zinc transporter ZntB n=1 Tax=Pontiella sp. TaxID=2837462 RepID=UPI0035669C91
MKNGNGLICAYLLKEGAGQPADWDRVKTWTPDQGVLWMHLDYADETVRQWLLNESGLNEVTCSALFAEETRPRIVSSPESLLLILRGVNSNPGADPEDMVSIRMWFDEHRIITMRHRRVLAIEDIRQSIEAGKGPDSADDFLVMIANRLIDRMGDVVSDIDDRADELEDMVLTKESHELRPMIADLRRQTICMRRYIAPQRDVLARLQNERIAWLSETAKVYLRETSERTARFVDDLDAARDRAAITQEQLNNSLSEQTNRTLYILSIITAIFLPLGLLTGLLGINVGGMPGTDSNSAFAIVVALLVVFAIIQYILFKRKKMI